MLIFSIALMAAWLLIAADAITLVIDLLYSYLSLFPFIDLN
ncbi:MAG: hypothetical protein ACR2GH_21765 [Pseudonocardia sp.]